MEIISTHVLEHNLVGQPLKKLAGSAQKEKPNMAATHILCI